MTLVSKSYIALADLRLQIPLDGQILPTVDILNHQAFLVGQVEQADEAVRSRDVGELVLGVDVREIVHDVGEHEGAVGVLRESGDLGFLLLVY
jgi:hypothetical protein